MVMKIIFWFIGYGFGLASIRFLPSFEDGGLSFLLSELIYQPDYFFVGMFSFCFSFLALSNLVKATIEECYAIMRRQNISILSFLLSINVSTCFYLLYKESVWVTCGLLIFTFVYGMISIDLKILKRT